MPGTFSAPTPASLTRCMLCDAVEFRHVCPYASGEPVPPLIASSPAWSERFALFAVVGFVGALISAVVAPALVLSLAALAVLCLVAAGVFWAIPTLYVGNKPASTATAATAEADPRLALRAALVRARGRVSPALAEHLRRVRATIEVGLAHADKTSTGDLDTHILRESALHYVPEAIDYYLSLPANAPRTLEGRTPEQELDYQLGLIEVRVQKVLDGKARELVDDFEAHGRFLRERLDAGTGLLDIRATSEAENAAAAGKVEMAENAAAAGMPLAAENAADSRAGRDGRAGRASRACRTHRAARARAGARMIATTLIPSAVRSPSNPQRVGAPR